MSHFMHPDHAIAETALLPAPAQLDDIIIAENIETTVLNNGLQVVIIPDRRAPIVTHMIWYKVGAADEAPGESGIAHFLEHLMFKGTTNYPDGAFSKIVAELGGQENAFTSWDYTAYFQRIAKEHLPQMMALEADRMANLVLSDDVVLPERNVVLEERAQRIDNNPSAKLSESLGATLYTNHPYGIPIIGWQHEIEQLNRETALAFYNRFYSPNNAVLIVAGDVEPEEIITLAKRSYGRVARRVDDIERIRPQEPEPRMQRQVVLRDARVEQPSVQISFLAPSYSTAKIKDYPKQDSEAQSASNHQDMAQNDAYALDVLAVLLGSGNSSRLYQSLVANDGLAAFAGAYYRSDGVDDTQFVIYALPREIGDMDRAQEQLKIEIDRLISGGVRDDELERAKRKLISSTLYTQDSQTSLARVFGTALTTGETIEDVQNWPKAIANVSGADIIRVAQNYLDFDRAVIGLQLPEQARNAE